MRRERRVREAQEVFFEGIGVPEQSATFAPDQFQLDAIESLAQGNDTLVIAPTGTGKTYIAVEAIRRTISQGQRAIYTAPLKALSNAKYADFRRLFEPEYRVGILTGDRKIETQADIVVATTEIYRNELYAFSENYALVVLDEFHYLADPQRGPVWEESIILSPRSATLLLLSASISNPEHISRWIESVRGRPSVTISVSHRPVELRLGFLHPEYGIVPLEEREGELFPGVEDFYSGGWRREPRRPFPPRRGGGGGGGGRGRSRRS